MSLRERNLIKKVGSRNEKSRKRGFFVAVGLDFDILALTTIRNDDEKK